MVSAVTKRIVVLLAANLLLLVSMIFASATEWQGQEYKSHFYPPSNDIIDDVKQKTIERYGLSEVYFDGHLILSSADVYCHESRYNQYDPSCIAKRENPHLLQQIQVNWIFVPEQEEYRDTPFFTTAKFFVGVTIYDEEGLDRAVEDMRRNTGFDMGRIVIDNDKKVIYSFPITDILKVIEPRDRLISKEEAKSKLLGCVNSFASEPYISYEKEFIYMGGDGPSDSEGKHKSASVNLETGDVIQCSKVGPAVLEESQDNIDVSTSKESIFKRILNWISRLFRTG